MKKIKVLTILFCCFMMVACGGKEKDVISRGVWKEDVFTSEFANIEYTKPTKWTIASDEQIARLMGFSASQMAELNEDGWSEEMIEESMEMSMIMDTLVVDPQSGNNMSISYLNLDQIKNGQGMTAKGYLELTGPELEGMNMGVMATAMQDPVVLGEDEYAYLTLENEAGYTQHMLTHKKSNRIILITITLMNDLDETVLETIFDSFS